MKKRPHPYGAPEAAIALPRYSKDTWSIVRCPRTGLVYLENPPDYEALEEDFAWEKTYEAEGRRRQVEEPIVSRLSAVAIKSRALLKRPRKIMTLPAECLRAGPTGEELVFVDVGAGDGINTLGVAEYLQSQLGRTVKPIAIEISKAQAAAADERLRGFNGGYCVQDAAVEGARELKGVQADLVLLSSFLEHEIQPVELLAACRELLKPEGILAVKVPNFACWNRRLRQEKWCGFRYPDHVNYFTPSTLRLGIEKAGLRVSRMKLRDRFPLSDNMYAVAKRREE